MILERIQSERFSRVLPLWSAVPVVVLGGGPSLTAHQFDLVRAAREADAVRVIAVNDAYLMAPWADVCYAADAKWFVWQGIGVDKPGLRMRASEVRERWASFPGQKCGIETAQPYLADDVHMLRFSHAPGLSKDAGAIASGRHDGYMGHSGFQALNLATLSGTKRILLLGFDGGPAPSGVTHFHGDHPIPTPADVWEHIRRSFSCIENDLKASGVTVLNCATESRIDTFPKVPLYEALGLEVV